MELKAEVLDSRDHNHSVFTARHRLNHPYPGVCVLPDLLDDGACFAYYAANLQCLIC